MRKPVPGKRLSGRWASGREKVVTMLARLRITSRTVSSASACSSPGLSWSLTRYRRRSLLNWADGFETRCTSHPEPASVTGAPPGPTAPTAGISGTDSCAALSGALLINIGGPACIEKAGMGEGNWGLTDDGRILFDEGVERVAFIQQLRNGGFDDAVVWRPFPFDHRRSGRFWKERSAIEPKGTRTHAWHSVCAKGARLTRLFRGVRRR